MSISLYGCAQQPPVTWKTVEAVSITGEEYKDSFTYQVGEEWEAGVNPGSYFPAGFISNNNDTMVTATIFQPSYSDYSSVLELPTLDDQYDYLLAHEFVDSNSSHPSYYSNIQKGTIGEYACVMAQYEGNALADQTMGESSPSSPPAQIVAA